MRRLLDDMHQFFEEEEYEELNETDMNSTRHKKPRKKGTTDHAAVLAFLIDLAISVLIVVPIYPILPIRFFQRYPPTEILYIEHMIILVSCLVLLYFLSSIPPIRKAIIITIFLSLITEISDRTTRDLSDSERRSFIKHYITLIKPLSEAPFRFEFTRSYRYQEPNERDIERIINQETPSIVRNYAIRAATMYWTQDNLYSNYGGIIRYLSLYKAVNEKFKYVHDPIGSEFFSSAENTILNSLQYGDGPGEGTLAGDCDDYSILMHALLSGISADVRLVLSPGHIYPEVNMGSIFYFLSEIKPLIDSLYELNPVSDLYFKLDENYNTWLNFDFGDHPGEAYGSNSILEIMD